MDVFAAGAVALIALGFCVVRRIPAFAVWGAVVVGASVAFTAPIVAAGLLGWVVGLAIVRAMLTRSVSLHLLDRIDRADASTFHDDIGRRVDDLRAAHLVVSTNQRLTLTRVGRTVAALVSALLRLFDPASRRAKLQTALPQLVALWAAGFVAAAWLLSGGPIGLADLAICWAGAFLVWFGVFSHLESSILLRMLALLRRAPMTRAELLDAYESAHGESLRIQELRRGGLITGQGDTIVLTPKGRAILSIVSTLR